MFLFQKNRRKASQFRQRLAYFSCAFPTRACARTHTQTRACKWPAFVLCDWWEGDRAGLEEFTSGSFGRVLIVP